MTGLRPRSRRRSPVRPFAPALLLVALVVAACSPVPAAPDAYEALRVRFDASAPGRGLDQYTPATVMDHPMAYAFFASAEAHRYSRTQDRASLARAGAAAEWLVQNADLDGDGATAWGLPFAWDAFGDGSENPEHNAYTITTAVAVQALLDVYEHTGDPRLLETALAGVSTFVYGALEPGDDAAWFWYSLAESDALPVFNVSAMMLGQLQRLTVHDPSLRRTADAVARHLLAHRDADGHWYYSAPGAIGDSRKNDLVHAAYIVQGLADYARFGGSVGIDAQSLYETLADFVVDGTVTEMPREPGPARAWGVGAALFTAGLLEQEFEVTGTLSAVFHAAALRYDPSPARFYPRQAAHVLVGLAVTTPGR